MRLRPIIVLAVMILSATLSAANPGGEGDSLQSMQCGGSCHGDAGQNTTSEAEVVVVAGEQVWAGLLTTVDVTITNPVVSNTRMLGVFLLINDQAAKDSPAYDGWEIVADPNGGMNNYVEKRLARAADNVTFTWTLRAPPAGDYDLLATIHHGGVSSGKPAHRTAETISFSIANPPENLPQLAAEFTPPATRGLGQETTVKLSTVNVDTFTVEWRSDGGTPTSVSVSDGEFTLPAAVNPGSIEWRAHLSGDGPDQTTPWFALIAEEPGWQIEEFSLYMQAFALLFLFAGLVMSQRPESNDGDVDKIPFALDTTSMVEQTPMMAAPLATPMATPQALPPPLGDPQAMPPSPATPAPAAATIPQMVPVPPAYPPIPLEGIPAGWTMDQWHHFGQEHLDKLNRENNLGGGVL